MLAMSREIDRVGSNSVLDSLINAVLEIGRTTTFFNQSLDTSLGHKFLITVKRVSGHAHNLASSRDVIQLMSQIQQTCLVFNNRIGSIKHESYLFMF
jgi:hypothetical protein